MPLSKENISFRKFLPLIVIGFACSHHNAGQQLFTQLSSSQTHVDFTNTLIDRDSLNILDYLYYYNGGGVATGDINNDGLPDIFFTANSKGHNKLYINKGNFSFEDVTEKSGMRGTSDWCTGVTMADVNGDGWLDIYVCAVSKKLGLKGHNQLYINNRNGTFTDSSAQYGLDFEGYSTQAVFFDYDHDGDLDCFLLNQSSHSLETFGDTSLRRHVSDLAGSRLFRNEMNTGKKKFTDVTITSGIYSSALGYGLGVSVADVNNDGWEDIYVGNDFHENDYYYLNNHDGTFAESGKNHFNHYSRFSMGNDIADYNNDGQLDIFTLDMLPPNEEVLKTYPAGDRLDVYNFNIVGNGFQQQFSKNCLQKNLGNGEGFSEQSLVAGVSATDWSWSPLFADYDNDGIKDLFISNGIIKRPIDLDYTKFISSSMVNRQIRTTHHLDALAIEKMPDGRVNNYVFKGNADGHFTDMSSKWGMTLPTSSNGAAYADLDNDGNLDLVVNNINEEAGIYKNNSGTSKHFLSLSFKGNNLNTMGIGCKAYIFNKGTLQYQQLMLTRGFQSSCDTKVHFGIDTVTVIDSVLVVWPNQTFQLLKNIKASQSLIIKEDEATGVFNYDVFFQKKKPLLKNVTAEIDLVWKHHENDFTDFNRQYFIPHEISTSGPKLAIGDVNGDGLDDIYACGAKGQPGALFIQTKDKHFIQTNDHLFDADAGCEDVDALFFDADGDGDMDLYVASGGNEAYGPSPLLLDRLYINDGKGNFVKSLGSLPEIYQNKSVVCAADIDHDGDMDLFVGVRADALSYGTPQTSYILLNDGKGKFAITGDNVAPLKNIGMVTSAAFADVNNDGWQDLIVAGEWMPVCVFINKQGSLIKQHPLLSGLWQCISLADVDGDGAMDIVAGNYGINSKLHASDEAPLKLYIDDLEKNGKTDQLLTYTTGGKEYSFLGKEELERQLPSIKKKFLYYSSFAGKTVQEVFGTQLDNAHVLNVQTLLSGIFKNDGRGNFSFTPLPAEVQEAPIFSLMITDINYDSAKDIMCGGNFYGVLPYEGRYDGNWGDILLNKGNKSYQWISPVNSGWFLRGEVRDIKKIRSSKGYLFVVARNNDTLLFFQQE